MNHPGEIKLVGAKYDAHYAVFTFTFSNGDSLQTFTECAYDELRDKLGDISESDLIAAGLSDFERMHLHCGTTDRLIDLTAVLFVCYNKECEGTNPKSTGKRNERNTARRTRACRN